MLNLSSPEHSVQQSGQSLTQSLRVFYSLNYVLVALSLLANIAGLGFLLSINAQTGYFGSIFFGGAVVILITVTLFLVYLRVIRSASETIETVAQYVSNNQTLETHKVHNFVRWLSYWQWALVIGAIFSVVPTMASGLLSPFLTTFDSQHQRTGIILGLVTGFSGLAVALPSVILAWLALSAIKKFFMSLVKRAGGANIQLRRVTQSAVAWLSFTLIILAVTAVLSLPGYLGVAAGLLIPQLLGSKFQIPLGIALLTLIPTVLLGITQLWQLTIIARSRGFANDVGTALDRHLDKKSAPDLRDLWQNAAPEETVPEQELPLQEQDSNNPVQPATPEPREH